MRVCVRIRRWDDPLSTLLTTARTVSGPARGLTDSGWRTAAVGPVCR